jgi:hypothetical protein
MMPQLTGAVPTLIPVFISQPLFGEIRNAPSGKSEIPNPKSETISKSKTTMSQTTQPSTGLNFGIGSFEFVSNFGFRASDFRQAVSDFVLRIFFRQRTIISRTHPRFLL